MWTLSSRLSSHDGSAVSSQYVQLISQMIFDEPCVYGMITNQQSMSLKHGIMVRWGHTPPTPSFQVILVVEKKKKDYKHILCAVSAENKNISTGTYQQALSSIL